jgi:hypothetical protein
VKPERGHCAIKGPGHGHILVSNLCFFTCDSYRYTTALSEPCKRKLKLCTEHKRAAQVQLYKVGLYQFSPVDP